MVHQNLVAFANKKEFVGYAKIPPNSISTSEVAVQFKSESAGNQQPQLGNQVGNQVGTQQRSQPASNILQISVITNGQPLTEQYNLNKPMEICLVATLTSGVWNIYNYCYCLWY